MSKLIWHDKLRKFHPTFNIHNHTDYSNNRFLDSKNTVPDIYKNAKAKGMAGIAITDHGVVIPAAVETAQLMDKDPDFFNGKDGHGTFTPVVGSEIYLDDFNIIKHAVDNNKKTKFFHFVLTAKDDIGLHALRIISSNSWGATLENIWNDHPKYHGFFYRGMRRLPTYKDWLSKLMHDSQFNFKGHVIASTACLGSELSQSIVNNDKPRAKKFIKYIENTFGKAQCYFEMMPAHRKSQEKVNKTLWNISHGNGYFKDNTGQGIPCIISTDAHYIDKRDQQAHSIFLKSENPNRDVKDFYKYAHLFTYDELKDYFPQNMLDEACNNSMKLLKRYAPIWHKSNEPEMKKLTKEHPNHPPVRLYYLQEIPDSPMPKVVKPINLQYYAKKYHVDWSKYPWFHKFAVSKYKDDRFYMHRLFKGMLQKHIPFNNEYLREINWELMTLHQLTEHFHEPMSSYFNTVVSEVVQSIWNCSPTTNSKVNKKLATDPKDKLKNEMMTGSILGPGRGSAGEWVTSYILGITQVNSLKWKLFPPRFSCRARALSNSMPDIDLDSMSEKRNNIMHYLKVHRGSDRVLNFSTFNTQAAKSTIYTCCRGMHINYKEAQNIANLLPADARGMGNISIHDALFGNKKKDIQPAKKFIGAISQHKGLKQALLNISSRIRGVSEHASGVALFNEPYTRRNAMMKTNKAPGIPISGGDAPQSAYLSSLKYDYLTLTGLDRIYEAVKLLLRDHKIKWLGNLHDTYLHYFGAQALDFTSPKMYDMLYNGEIPNAFEFDSLVGRRALLQVQAHDFPSLVATNSLMRLSVDPNSNTHESHIMKKYWGKEQPIARFVRYRDHKDAWDKDMKKFGLTKHERDIMHFFLQRHHGVCYSQEDLMKIAMRICYGVKDYMKVKSTSKLAFVSYNFANMIRKAVAKKNPKILEQARQKFYKLGKKRGVRPKFLDYVWYNCAVPAKNYSFNLAHGVAYTIILIIEMNICYRFGPIYWQTACLSVNAGMYGNNINDFKNPNYNKLCHALSNKFIANKLMPPSINHSGYGFVPYKNKILFGLYPIVGISGKNTVKIVNNRPYTSFSDFLHKTQFSTKENIQLIKSGCFDEFKPSDVDNYTYRLQLMKKYVCLEVPLKKRLTMVQIPKVAKHIPEKYDSYVKVWKFRSHITGRKKRPLTKAEKQLYQQHYAKHVETASHTSQLSLLSDNSKKSSNHTKSNKINVKAFNKWYNKFTRPLKAWLKTAPALKAEASTRRNQLWRKYCDGNPESWEMDALGCYIGKHELQITPIAKAYHVTPYSKVITYHNFGKLNLAKPQTIYGTLIGKNANKHLAYVLTPQGIANVRVGKNKYAIYNKRNKKPSISHQKQIQKVFKGSWFTRGIKLLCRGNKLDDNFFIDWNENPYPLYIILGYGKHAHVIDVNGQLANTKPKFRKYYIKKINKIKNKKLQKIRDAKDKKITTEKDKQMRWKQFNQVYSNPLFSKILHKYLANANDGYKDESKQWVQNKTIELNTIMRSCEQTQPAIKAKVSQALKPYKIKKQDNTKIAKTCQRLNNQFKTQYCVHMVSLDTMYRKSPKHQFGAMAWSSRMDCLKWLHRYGNKKFMKNLKINYKS